MSRASDAGNGLMKAVQDMCDLYRVPAFRMQSRAFTVAGAGGKERPMFVGAWRDDFGEEHKGGMPDWLLTPQIRIELHKVPIPPAMDLTEAERQAIIIASRRVNVLETVPVWVECKAGTGKLSPRQKKFQDYIERMSGYYLAVKDGPEALEQWFQKYGVRKP